MDTWTSLRYTTSITCRARVYIPTVLLADGHVPRFFPLFFVPFDAGHSILPTLPLLHTAIGHFCLGTLRFFFGPQFWFRFRFLTFFFFIVVPVSINVLSITLHDQNEFSNKKNYNFSNRFKGQVQSQQKIIHQHRQVAYFHSLNCTNLNSIKLKTYDKLVYKMK